MTAEPIRQTVSRKEGFVVFLIGSRLNHWWALPMMWAVARAMGRMMNELVSDPDSGLLSYENYVGRTTLAVQYWRSLYDLLKYASHRERAHVPAWRRWVKEWGLSGAMGVWHETYVIEPGQHETLYNQMPPFGLGKVGPLVPAEGPLHGARGRLAEGAKLAR